MGHQSRRRGVARRGRHRFRRRLHDEGPHRQAPDLAGQTFVSPHDFIWDDNTPVDLDGHGTHVTGTIAQRTGNDLGVAGMAFNVAIMPVKVLSGLWDEILGAPNVGTERDARARHFATRLTTAPR